MDTPRPRSARRLADEYDAPPEVIEADVRRLLGELERNEIVADAGRADD